LGNAFRVLVKGYKAMKQKPKVEVPEVEQIIQKQIIQQQVGGGGETTIKTESVGVQGIKISGEITPEQTASLKEFKGREATDIKKLNIAYPLIPKWSTHPFAGAVIRWSRQESSLIYYLIEPQLTAEEKKILEKIKLALIEKLDIDFAALRKEEAKSYLRGKFEEMIKLIAAELPPEKQQQILYYIERDFIGLGKIEPLMQDPQIEDISCDGVGIPIFVYHRNPLIGSIKTNVVFDTKEELDTFVNKLAQRTGKTISVANPLIDATLPDGSRLQATLGTDIARRGSNFTIRKFTEEPLTPTHMMKFKTMDEKIGAYLWLLIEHGRSILISGGVASGKTSLLNAVSLFIKPELKVVTIEDTAELRLPHPHWVPSVARQPITEIEGKKIGEVDLFDLLRESLRQRPDYLIVGEVRGREAYVLFQQIATGHASLSTIHADSMERLIDRLTTPPISLPASLIEALDVVIFLVRVKYGNSYVRRISNVFEILGFDREKNFPIFNEVFRWEPKTDTYEEVKPSIVLKKIGDQYGLSEAYLRNELANRMKVLKWMYDKDILNFNDFGRVVKIYYSRPEELLRAI